jgi:hypothetical protein
MPEFQISPLLDTRTVALRNVHCTGDCRHRSDEECTALTHLVFPYRGVYMRHVVGKRMGGRQRYSGSHFVHELFECMNA